MSQGHAIPAAAAGTVPFVRMDRDDPELLEELLGVVRTVAEESSFILGQHVEGFEADFAAYCETDEAVGVASGTDAIALALRALGIGKGDEVILPANTFIATAEAVSIAGATPRLVDVDPVTGLITAELAERALSSKVRCIIPVHLYGATVDMDPILELARSARIAVIEDACQAHGARYRGRRVGSMGHMGCFSFYPAKNLGAWGDGGAVMQLAGKSKILTRLDSVTPKWISQIQYVSEDGIKKQGDVIRKVMKAVFRAQRFMRTNTKEAAELAAKGAKVLIVAGDTLRFVIANVV